MQRLTRSEDRKLPRKYCQGVTKPARKRECNTQECPPVWYKGPWTEVCTTLTNGYNIVPVTIYIEVGEVQQLVCLSCHCVVCLSCYCVCLSGMSSSPIKSFSCFLKQESLLSLLSDLH